MLVKRDNQAEKAERHEQIRRISDMIRQAQQLLWERKPVDQFVTRLVIEINEYIWRVQLDESRARSLRVCLKYLADAAMRKDNISIFMELRDLSRHFAFAY